ncbi:NmrA-like family protein [Podospora didyma]|uniref:NmrA-like family protein n=1 Tax=Podospora didyma TaxID=330526 RepID=A0AAE0U7M6_9PEZI|nr:NmrA-like family protein [Podospora didyma]
MSRALIICGATGKQGGAVIKQLLSETHPNDFEILAVTRDANSASAQRLLAKAPTKIKLLQGDLADPASLFKSAAALTTTPIWGVFSVQVAIGSGSELHQGKALVDAALAAGTVHMFVYTSVDRHGEADSFANPTSIPHFGSKHAIEHHLVDSSKGTEMDWAILRPVAFMENLTDNYFGRVFVKSWGMAVREKPLQLVAVSDIGFFAAQAFLNPAEYKGRGVSLAGDEVTLEQVKSVFEAKTGKKLASTNGIFPWLLMKMMKDFGVMFKWFHEQGYAADIEKLRVINPGMKDFGAWLETESDFAEGIKARK